MERIRRNFAIWARFSGLLVLEKVLGACFYWFTFPVVLSGYGVVRGSIGLFVFQFVVSVVFITIYDKIGKDLFGIVAVKQKCLDLLARFKGWLGWREEAMWLRKFGWVMEFILFSWQFVPFVALLCLRKVGTERKIGQDACILFTSSLFATVYWVSLHRGVISVAWNFVKNMVS